MIPSPVKTTETLAPPLWLPLCCAVLLLLFTFTLPDREGPESAANLDLIALIKLGLRLASLGGLGILFLKHWGTPRHHLIAWTMLPLGLYLAWAVLSTLWSPLKSVSLGQALSLMVQLLLTAVIGLLCTREEQVSRVLKTLSLALLATSGLILIVYAFDPIASGLTRSLDENTTGMVHPTSAGATAGLGLSLLCLGWLLWGWRWALWLLPIGAMIHGPVLILAASRMALLMTLVTALVSFALFGYRQWLAAIAFVGCSVVGLYLMLDPALDLAERTLQSTTAYASRGESTEQLASLTGRTELWEAIGVEIRKSPLLGHGYFVTSENGLLDVWSGPENRTAHNVLLQVLVSTGAVGLVLFLWSLARPLLQVVRAQLRPDAERRWGWFLLLMGGWYSGWGQLCESFMGPIQPESIVFFLIFGLALGRLPTPEARRALASVPQPPRHAPSESVR